MKRQALKILCFVCISFSLSSCLLFGGAQRYPDGGYGYTYTDPYQTNTSSNQNTGTSSSQNTNSTDQSDSSFWDNLFGSILAETEIQIVGMEIMAVTIFSPIL